MDDSPKYDRIFCFPPLTPVNNSLES
jgi:hypothetical protein